MLVICKALTCEQLQGTVKWQSVDKCLFNIPYYQPRFRPGMVLSIYEVFQFLPPITDTKIKIVVAITDYTLLQPSDHKLVITDITLALENGDCSSLQTSQLVFSHQSLFFSFLGLSLKRGSYSEKFLINCQEFNFFFSSLVRMIFFGATACRIFLRTSFPCMNFFWGVVTPSSVISNGPPITNFVIIKPEFNKGNPFYSKAIMNNE